MSSLPASFPPPRPHFSWVQALGDALVAMGRQTTVDGLLAQVADEGSELSDADAVVVSTPTRSGWQVSTSSDSWLGAQEPPAWLGATRRGRDALTTAASAIGVHRLTDLVPETRSSVWARALLAHGWQQLWWVRVEESRRGSLLGALAFYRRDLDPTGPTEATTLFSQHVALAWTRLTEQEQLGVAIEARHRVGLAQGLLMARYRIDADQAFAAMQRYSQNSNVKLRDVAAGVVRTGELPRLP